MRPRLLDLFCGAGGAAMGYHRAGFRVIGVDVRPQPRYPFEFIQGDVMELVTDEWDTFDAIHASPPCQAYSRAKAIRGRQHPDLVGPVRARLLEVGVPWVIENVPGAPLKNPTLLCGMMFGLHVYRHRLFESSVHLPLILHPPHHAAAAPMGRPVKEGDIITPVGHFTNVPYGRRAMGIPWMTQGELAEAIPPAYTQWIGEHLMQQLRKVA